MAGPSSLFVDYGGTLVMVRDGRTVIDEAGNPLLRPHVAEVLGKVRSRFGSCFIVSNQPRIGRGEITEREVLRRFEWLNACLGHPFTDWRLCPHQDGDGCPCRKPMPGMFLDLARVHGLDLAASLHVGDSEKDRVAAEQAGIGSFAWADDFFSAGGI